MYRNQCNAFLTHPGLLRSPAPLFKKERGAANSQNQIVLTLCFAGLFTPSLF